MKEYILIITLVLCFCSCLSEETYETINLRNLLGHKVSVILNKNIFKNYDKYNFSSSYYPKEDNSELYAVNFFYNDNIRLTLHLDSLRHTPSFNKDEVWDFSLIKKERVKGIQIIKYKPLKLTTIQEVWKNE